MMASITKTIIFIGLLCALSGCGVSTKVKKSPYSFDFFNSNFYRGYTVLVEEQSCINAIEYFRTGLDNYEYVEISTLYYDYCIESDESEVSNYFVSSLSILNGDSDNWRSNGLSDDEFTWINSMSEQGGTVEQFAIGKMYLNGYILEKNKEELTKMFDNQKIGNFFNVVKANKELYKLNDLKKEPQKKEPQKKDIQKKKQVKATSEGYLLNTLYCP